MILSLPLEQRQDARLPLEAEDYVLLLQPEVILPVTTLGIAANG
jgi:hypothetical protein